MKKIISIILVLAMALAFAACGGDDSKDTANNDGTNAPAGTNASEGTNAPAGTESQAPADTQAPASDMAAVDVLTSIYGSYTDDEKVFPVCGGDQNNMVDNAPGAYALTDAAMMDSMLGIPEAEVGKLDSAASMMHMMNANTFTSAAYVVKDGTDVDALLEAIKTDINSKQWMCGFPETLVTLKSGNIIVTAFGADDLIQVFKTHALNAVDGMTLVFEGPVEFGGDGMFQVPGLD